MVQHLIFKEIIFYYKRFNKIIVFSLPHF